MNNHNLELPAQWGGDPESRWTRTYEMPFIIGAVGAAVGTLTTAATLGVASVGVMAVVGATATLIGAAATIAGLAMTIVGAVTGDKELMQIGGYVGLAGGVAGLAGGAITSSANAAVQAGTSAATSAAPAASAATQGATGGTAGLTSTTATNAITPTFSSVGQQTALSGAGNAATGAVNAGTTAVNTGTGLLGNAGNAALNSVSPVMESAKLGANIGADVGASASTATQVASQSNSFFDKLMQPNNLLEIGKLGSGFIQGAAQSDKDDLQRSIYKNDLLIKQQELDFKRMQDARMYQNANTQGRLDLSTRDITPEEIEKYKIDQANLAKKQAQILTAPAT